MTTDPLGELLKLFGLDPDDRDERLGVELAQADTGLIEALVALREHKRLRQRDVAARMGRDQAAVSNFERLGADPHLSTVRRYARAVGARVVHEVTDAEGAPAQSGSAPVFRFTTSVTNESTVAYAVLTAARSTRRSIQVPGAA